MPLENPQDRPSLSKLQIGVRLISQKHNICAAHLNALALAAKVMGVVMTLSPGLCPML